MLQRLSDAIYSNRYQLESLFRWFDEDSSGSISLEEFKHGLTCLENLGMMPKDEANPLEDEILTSLLKRIDSNYDGEIGYDEFFDAFKDAVKPAVTATI